MSAVCPRCGKKEKSPRRLVGKLPNGSISCNNCVKADDKPKCPACGEPYRLQHWKGDWVPDSETIGDRTFCSQCVHTEGEKYRREWAERVKAKAKQMLLTTTHNIDGYKVRNYIDIISYEYIIGTGVLSEMSLGVTDFFGARSGMGESKLADARKKCMEALRVQAATLGGDAVIGVDLDYTEFAGNRIGVIGSGTVVTLQRDE